MDSSKAITLIGGILVIAILAAGGIYFVTSGDDEATTDEDDNVVEDQQTEDNMDENMDEDMEENMEENMDEEPTEDGEPNIVEAASERQGLSTLVTAVQEAELVEALSDETKTYTVFAPNNRAFDALPEGTLEDLLLPENQEQLVDILTYHVVEGAAVLSSNLEDGQEVTTLNGQTLTVTINEEGVFIGDAQVLTPDLETSNGVVHVIDTVLLPESN
jgi:uncharacterized surface protein with fasciclin (FAS1) repeats